jgi:DNA-binding GntR family transcriptional regulator
MRSIPELVHDYVKGRILAGTYSPGEALRQEEIASHLGVSRAPVREALNQLEREGLVVLRPRRGFVVVSLDAAEIEEIFQLRMMLEEHAARMATRRRTPAEVAAACEIIDRIDRLDLEDPELASKFTALNRDFHAVIYNASRQKRLFQIASNLRDSVEQYVRLDTALAERLGEAQREHREILAAFEAGDAERAAQVSRQHCQHTYERLMNSLQYRREPGAS